MASCDRIGYATITHLVDTAAIVAANFQLHLVGRVNARKGTTTRDFVSWNTQTNITLLIYSKEGNTVTETMAYTLPLVIFS